MATEWSLKQPFVLIGALLERDGKFLVLEENHGEDKGYWNIPSGKLDLGESPLECVKREVKEESGLDFEPKAVLLISSNVRQRPDRHPLHAFRVIFTGDFSGEVNFDNNDYDEAGDREISSHRWVSPEEIKSLPMRQPDIPTAVSRYLKGETLPLDAVQHFTWERPPRF